MIIESIEDGERVGYNITFQPHVALDRSNLEQLNVMLEALKIYEERNQKYKDNWRRQGWRSCLFDLRRKVERVWDTFWNHPDSPCEEGWPTDREPPDLDDALDTINFAALATRAVREGNRDGSWSW